MLRFCLSLKMISETCLEAFFFGVCLTCSCWHPVSAIPDDSYKLVSYLNRSLLRWQQLTVCVVCGLVKTLSYQLLLYRLWFVKDQELMWDIFLWTHVCSDLCICFFIILPDRKMKWWWWDTNLSPRLQGSKATGGFILTASHNPGGPTEVRSVLVLCLLSAAPFSWDKTNSWFRDTGFWNQIQYGKRGTCSWINHW